MSIQDVLQIEKRGRMIVCLRLNICSEICSFQLNAMNGMREKDLVWGPRVVCLEISKGYLSSVNRKNNLHAS